MLADRLKEAGRPSQDNGEKPGLGAQDRGGMTPGPFRDHPPPHRPASWCHAIPLEGTGREQRRRPESPRPHLHG